ncbi:MAG: helix-turn-helix domain-containing protein [Motiliproteus sp.]|nr:helix-turn-helix domain-containing protein [Motiliproteus sp.]MCW9051643.1 helix-turn-helix domain-containing protein [Motiliproteus sp.]
MDLQLFTIGQLSKQTGCKVPTIRYYEGIELLPNPPRTEGGQRRYNAHHLQTLRFICHGRELGFPIKAIRELLELDQFQQDSRASTEDGCHRADQIALEHLHRIERKIDQLSGLRDELKMMINACKSGDNHSCQVMSVLADHQLCQHSHGAADDNE